MSLNWKITLPFGNLDHTTAQFLRRMISACVDGITTSAHGAGRLLGHLQSRKRGCESLEREGRGKVGRGQSGQIGTPLSFPMPDCDGMAPQGKSAKSLKGCFAFSSENHHRGIKGVIHMTKNECASVHSA